MKQFMECSHTYIVHQIVAMAPQIAISFAIANENYCFIWWETFWFRPCCRRKWDHFNLFKYLENFSQSKMLISNNFVIKWKYPNWGKQNDTEAFFFFGLGRCDTTLSLFSSKNKFKCICGLGNECISSEGKIKKPKKKKNTSNEGTILCFWLSVDHFEFNKKTNNWIYSHEPSMVASCPDTLQVKRKERRKI